MTPLKEGGPPANPVNRDLYDELRQSLSGEVRFDDQSRALYATDASNYRHVPAGVVVPADQQDVETVLRVCRKHGMPLVSRGGGTGLAGQSLGTGLVMDHSKMLRGVLEVKPLQRKARVLPGTVLDHLQKQASESGLVFGPDPSTHGWCTFGGMIGNNSCGVHGMLSEFYGPGPRTEDNLHSMEVLTYRGERMHVGRTTEKDYQNILIAGGPRAEIYRRLRGLVDKYGDAIRGGFPKLSRRVSGYNLPSLLPENGFDVGKALVGSEGTCVTVLEATVELCPRLPSRVLLVLGYPDIFSAGDDVPRVRQFKPVGLEAVDGMLVDHIRSKGMNAEYTQLLPEGEGWLLAEFGAGNEADALAAAHEAERALKDSRAVRGHVLLKDPADQAHLWSLRESALGATAFVPGRRDAWPGWEDSAVPVEALGDYLRGLKKLYDRYGYSASLYGHFGQGCVHTRINFDLRSGEGLDRYMEFTRDAAKLCVSHGGSLSGEHGDGQQRSDLLPVMYSPEILKAFREFKAIWDPDGRMNPGKIVDPLPRDLDLRQGPSYPDWKPQTHFEFSEDEGDFSHTTLRCVGVGKCRSDGGLMCPSYSVTREEAYTTRGRARLFYEMLNGDFLKGRWRSRQVKESLDLCLSCKGCKQDCPVNVDIATYKSEFLSHYYRFRPRPRQAYAMGLIHRWARLGARMPRLANWITQSPGLEKIAKFAAGIAAERKMPSLAAQSFRKGRAKGRSSAPLSGQKRVLLWVDCFNGYFNPEVLHAAERVLRAAGCDVVLASKPLCCGRPLYDFGMLGTAKKLWKKTMRELRSEIEAGTPVVGVEPSCVAAFKDELPGLFPDSAAAKALSTRVQNLDEYLVNSDNAFSVPALKGKALLHGHCHQKSLGGMGHTHELLERMGLSWEEPENSCCGMAGSFGFGKDQYELSREIAEQRLLPGVRQAPGESILIADGFSCREQVAQLTGRRPAHLAQILSRTLD